MDYRVEIFETKMENKVKNAQGRLLMVRACFQNLCISRYDTKKKVRGILRVLYSSGLET